MTRTLACATSPRTIERLDPAVRQRGRLSSADARNMVRVREARRAFRDFHAQCFWYLDPGLRVTLRDVPEIARGLRQNGGRKGFLVAARLCR